MLESCLISDNFETNFDKIDSLCYKLPFAVQSYLFKAYIKWDLKIKKQLSKSLLCLLYQAQGPENLMINKTILVPINCYSQMAETDVTQTIKQISYKGEYKECTKSMYDFWKGWG